MGVVNSAEGVVCGARLDAWLSSQFKNKDDGHVSVMISRDIAYDGQELSWTRYVDPFEEPGVKMEGQEVLEFPRYENFKPILLKIRRSKVYQGRLNVTLAEVLELEVA